MDTSIGFVSSADRKHSKIENRGVDASGTCIWKLKFWIVVWKAEGLGDAGTAFEPCEREWGDAVEMQNEGSSLKQGLNKVLPASSSPHRIPKFCSGFQGLESVGDFLHPGKWKKWGLLVIVLVNGGKKGGLPLCKREKTFGGFARTSGPVAKPAQHPFAIAAAVLENSEETWGSSLLGSCLRGSWAKLGEDKKGLRQKKSRTTD